MRMGAVGGPGLPPGLDDPEEKKDRQKPTPFQIITHLALPIALAAVAYFQPRSLWFWGLVGVAFIPVVIIVAPPIKNRIQRRLARRRDKRRTHEAFPEFKNFVARFGRFVESDAKEFLGKIVNRRLRGENVTNAKELGMTPERVFQGFWYQLHQRVQDANPSLTDVTTVVTEFNHLVNQYLNETVLPVFDRMSPTTRSSLPDDAKRDLESFREKLVHYLNEYEAFARTLAQSLETCDLREPYLPRPKPHP